MKFLPSFLIRTSSILKKEEAFFPTFFIFFTEVQEITSQNAFIIIYFEFVPYEASCTGVLEKPYSGQT